MAAKKKKSARKGAKTIKACKAAGGRPVHFKGMPKNEVVCFTKTSKKRRTKKGKGRKGSTKGLEAACKAAKKAGFKGKKKSLRAPCAVVLG